MTYVNTMKHNVTKIVICPLALLSSVVEIEHFIWWDRRGAEDFGRVEGWSRYK